MEDDWIRNIGHCHFFSILKSTGHVPVILSLRCSKSAVILFCAYLFPVTKPRHHHGYHQEKTGTLGVWDCPMAGKVPLTKTRNSILSSMSFVNTLLPIDIFSFWLIIIKVKISPCEIGRYLKYKYRKCK